MDEVKASCQSSVVSGQAGAPGPDSRIWECTKRVQFELNGGVAQISSLSPGILPNKTAVILSDPDRREGESKDLRLPFGM
jgi:hypothetical protein